MAGIVDDEVVCGAPGILSTQNNTPQMVWVDLCRISPNTDSSSLSSVDSAIYDLEDLATTADTNPPTPSINSADSGINDSDVRFQVVVRACDCGEVTERHDLSQVQAMISGNRTLKETTSVGYRQKKTTSTEMWYFALLFKDKTLLVYLPKTESEKIKKLKTLSRTIANTRRSPASCWKILITKCSAVEHTDEAILHVSLAYHTLIDHRWKKTTQPYIIKRWHRIKIVDTSQSKDDKIHIRIGNINDAEVQVSFLLLNCDERYKLALINAIKSPCAKPAIPFTSHYDFNRNNGRSLSTGNIVSAVAQCSQALKRYASENDIHEQRRKKIGNSMCFQCDVLGQCKNHKENMLDKYIQILRENKKSENTPDDDDVESKASGNLDEMNPGDTHYHSVVDLIQMPPENRNWNCLQISTRARKELGFRLYKLGSGDPNEYWEHLASKIGFDDQTLEHIQRAEYIEGRHHSITAGEIVLLHWEQLTASNAIVPPRLPASRENLKAILEDMGRFDLVDWLENRRIFNTLPQQMISMASS